MLILSALIISALGSAVASFFIAGGQWLLFVSAALVILAFYASQLSAKANSEPEVNTKNGPVHHVRQELTVTIDDRIIEDSRHCREAGESDEAIAG
jgi:uncharacterized protein (DUF58 family)